jgi:hypothetical protein
MALLLLTEPKGAYDTDRLKHAENTIKSMVEISKKALKIIGVKITEQNIKDANVWDSNNDLI